MRRTAEALAAVLQGLLLRALYLLVALPTGLVWRALRPHPSWGPSRGTRWQDPDTDRDAETLDGARGQG